MKHKLEILSIVVLGIAMFPFYVVGSIILGEDAFEWWDRRR